MRDTDQLTLLLRQWQTGDDQAAARLLAVVYRDLRRMAGALMRHERRDHTLQATALVHEAWIRLSKSASTPHGDRQHFFAAMAAYMRRQLIDHARRRTATKRGDGHHFVPLDEAALVVLERDTTEEEFARLDAAIAALVDEHPRCARVLQLRFFEQRSIDETASELSVSTGTVKRDFTFARAFLAARLGGTPSKPPPAL
jgi:RNA polymerase sigma-70 factor (ECF subfamily)